MTDHRIELTNNAKPSFQKPHCAGPVQRKLEEDIEKMVNLDVIEPATSEWAAPIVFAPKKCGSLCFCVDYLCLKAATVRDSYPISRMDNFIDSLATAKVFLTLDCNSGY